MFEKSKFVATNII